ncbi:hypothetical protein ABZT26_25935 [Streptomyces sp. NPDC005395]|uniref:hypothetical protein n=1 Tax=Streptomyces sp. NPDC005395 TaxID=3157042 RepID=UPI0033B77AC1
MTEPTTTAYERDPHEAIQAAEQMAALFASLRQAFTAVMPLVQELMSQYQQAGEEFRRLGLLDEDYEPVRRRGVDAQRSPYGPRPKRSRGH